MALIKINNRSSEDNAIHGRRNLIINGAMQVWQRGTGAITSVTNGFVGVDRFKLGFTNTFSSQQQSLTSSETPYNLGFRKYMRLTNTSAVNTGGELVQMYTNLEGQDIAGSGWDYTSSSSYLTLTFWARCSLAGTYYVRFQTQPSSGTNRQYSVPFTLSADTWTKITTKVPGNSSLEIDDDIESRFSVFIIPHYGTNYSDPTANDEEWRLYPDTTALVGTDFSQNFKNTNNATFDLTGIQLEVGEIATPFEHRSYGEELSLCSRYYHTSFSGETTIGGSHPANYAGKVFSWCDQYGSSPDRVAFNYQWPVQMRDIPTVTMYGNQWTSARVSRYNGGSNEYTIDYASGVSRNGLGGYYDVAAGATGDFVVAYVEASAEI